MKAVKKTRQGKPCSLVGHSPTLQECVSLDVFSCKIVKSRGTQKEKEVNLRVWVIPVSMRERVVTTVISLMTILLFLGLILQERLSACYSVVFLFPFPHSFSLAKFSCFVKCTFVPFFFFCSPSLFFKSVWC